MLVYIREFGGLGWIWTLQAELSADDGTGVIGFGADVAIDGDMIAIGAPFRDLTGAADCGTVYVFSRAGTAWIEDEILIKSDPTVNDRFGWSVDMDGDVLVAGAPLDDGGGSDAGAVFVVRRVGGVWSEEQKLLADAPSPGANLGSAVSVDGGTVIAGAPGTEVSGQTSAGAAHVFVGGGGVWGEEQQLTSAIAVTNHFFGTAVGVFADTAVVGVPGWRIRPVGSAGSVEVFERDGATWVHLQRLVSDAPENGAGFGSAVEMSTDGIVVGAQYEDYLPSFPGAVYWYVDTVVKTDLSITKDDGVTEVVPGTEVSYMTVVTNAGPSEVMGAAVSDTFPPELLNCNWTCVAFGGAVCTPGPVAGSIADPVDLPVGSHLEYTADCTVASSATGTLTNTATVTAPPGVADTEPLNNSATDIDALSPEADLSIAKDNGVTQLIGDETTVYTILVTNNGPSDAAAAPVNDVFPAELAGCSWTCTPGAGAACTPSGLGDISDLADLPAGNSVTYLATCTVAASVGSCVNTADVAVPAGVTDPDPLNNDATDSDEIIAVADLIFADGFESGDTTAWTTVVH